ncbi:PQQ-dependent sugar dehydrogenase [Aquimarina sp. Aq78]|uniref:PQQ-dependent sugar dehydrogenase n=1 Tax=Aquimarina sp. Aq78 TaxID=1191889 RepID=UPI000D0FDD63|nr:PQQ-dependent sugar dehydrogenase [Aquimarina sp. Aq78]
MKTLLKTYLFIIVTLSTCGYIHSQITYKSIFPNISFEFPVEIQCINNGSDRMFVVEQNGKIKVFPKNENVTSSQVNTFLNITDRVQFSNGQELGLLGFAFHPNYSSNGYFYVYYTKNSPVSGISTRMVLSRFTVKTDNPNLADPNSELILFQFDKNQDNSNHNGGKIGFGPDSYLYISFGDGGGANDPKRNGQNKNTVFGSICRIDVDLDGSNPVESNPILPNGNYEIPSDNPFVGTDGLDEIYAYGIRNTWKFSFDKPTGRMWGADVGQNAFEEINLIKNGKNYGWSRFEGTSVANSNVIISGPVESPIFNYNHNQGDVSITGGYVYRGSKITSLTPDINSKYIFSDYVSGRVWALNYNPSTGNTSSELLFKTNGLYISSFGLDTEGELYFSSYGNNAKIYKLTDGNTSPPGTVVNGIGSWSSLNQGVNGGVQAIASDSNGNIYHGGNFSKAGNINANNIAVWNKNSGWSTLGSGANGSINTLKIASNGNLYAGGVFTKIGGINANNIAVWNGSQWSALGSGIDGTVAVIETDSNNNVFVGGVFKTINGTTVRNIAKWNGSQWSALEDVTNKKSGTNNEIRSLAIGSDGTLYVGGNFDEAGGNIAKRIATWNGSNWGTLGDGTSGFVEAITTTPTTIYIGGNFALAGNTTVNRIAKWNIATNSWSKLGNGVNNNVRSLLHDGTHLYAAGAFTTASDNNSNKIVNNIAQWSENNGWKALGTNTNVGVDIIINAITLSSQTKEIFVGGNFSKAGAINAKNTASWSNSPNTSCTATVPTEVSSSAVGSDTATIGWTAVAGATYDLRYRQTGTTTWTTSAENGTSKVISGLNPSTAYEVQVRSKCTDGTTSNYSSSTNFTTTDVQLNYCASNGQSITDEYISNVKLGTINKTSTGGSGGYNDFTAESTNLSKGNANTITITPTWTGRKYDEGYSVWIDYNQDGDFADTGEQVWTNAASQTTPVSGDFTVPATAKNGNTRMRVSMKYNAIPTPCESFDYGEVEDYTVVISGSGADTQAPSAPVGLTASNVAQTTLTLSWDAATDNVGVTGYDVYQGATNLGSVTATTRNITGLTANTAYQFTVKAKDAAGNESTVSSTLNVTTAGASSTYDVKLRITFDRYPQDTSWEIKDVSDQVIHSGGSYESQAANSTINITKTLDKGCYTFVIKDAYSDGLCCRYGNGSYELTNVSTNTILASGASFTSEEIKNFCVGTNSTNLKIDLDNSSFKIYPNPAESFIIIKTNNSNNSSFKIVNKIGQIIKTGIISRNKIELNNLPSGLYFISVTSNTKTQIKKFIIK